MAEYKIVYAIIERGARRHWLRVGMAFPNRDGSLNVRLDAVPFTGQLHIRDDSGRASGAETDPAPPDEPTATRTLRSR
jgi:hypothetical protein